MLSTINLKEKEMDLFTSNELGSINTRLTKISDNTDVLHIFSMLYSSSKDTDLL